MRKTRKAGIDAKAKTNRASFTGLKAALTRSYPCRVAARANAAAIASDEFAASLSILIHRFIGLRDGSLRLSDTTSVCTRPENEWPFGELSSTR